MNKNNIITCLLTLLALLCPMQGKASYMFKHYGVQNGLSQSTVYTIMQDRTGFIWIGTKEGLNRFDGTSFKIYRAYNDEHSLQSDFITSLYEDADGNIWVGTDIGVWIYNPMTDSFHHFNTKTAGGTLITNSVNVITGNNRYIYISANEQGVFRYDIKERSLTNNPLPGYSNVVGMSLGKDNRIWLGLFGDGLYSADLSLRNVQPFTAADGSQPFANDIVSSILPYSADRLYIGADRHGLCEVNTSTRQCNIIADRYDGKNIFVRMVAQKQNEIWAASEMGLYIYNVATRSVQHFMYNPADPFSLSDNPLYCLFQDRDGGMWAGSYFGGVNYLPNTNPLFERFVPQGNMHGRRVREMVQDRNGLVWIGTEDAGLNCMNPQTGEIQYIKESESFPNVHGLCIDGDRLWVGSFSYGLRIIDTNSKQVVRTFLAGNRPGDLHDNTVICICRAPNGSIYLGTIRGVCRYNSATDRFDYIAGVPPVLINNIAFDSKGCLWVATQTNGVYMLPPNSSRWTNFTAHNSRLTSNKALTIFEDNEGIVWVTTQGGGAYRYDRTDKQLKQFMVGRNNIGSTIFRIVEDRHGCLWFTTYAGLVSYNPSTKQLRSYSNNSLLLDNQFNYNSSLLAKDGKIYLGSLSGIIRFAPEKLNNNVRLPKLVVTQLNIGNEAINNFSPNSPLEKNIVFTKELSLAHSQNSFALHVVPLDYANTLGLEIEYKLEGFDRDWQPIRADHIIAYSNLPSGSYKLRVRMKDYHNQWSKDELELKIDVRPHFLLSIWAKLLYLMLLCFIVWRAAKYANERSIQKRQKAIEKFEHEKEQELYQSKIHFFTNVAHEIRTPLTLIKAPLENIISSGCITNAEVKDDLDIMAKNANRLSDLINQLLDFRKTERDGLRLNYELCNIERLVTAVYDRFRSVMRERGINSSISMQNSNLHAYVDHEAFTKIVSNLVNNAVKYCASRVSVLLSADEERFTLVVKNDGNIIPPEMRDKIFQPFFRLDTTMHTTASGTGIGLAMAKSLAELHGGTLVMDDDLTMNVFRLSLPIKQQPTVVMPADDSRPTDDTELHGDKKYTLLLVEDNVEMLDYERKHLLKNYNILTANDGEEALQVLADHTVNLVVSDIMMEPMDGITLLKNIKQSATFSHIPVVLLTAVTSDSAKLEGMENGADAYIVKPFSMNYLAETVANLLRQREEIKKAYIQSPFVSSESVSISTADTDFLTHLKEVMKKNIDNSDFNVDMLASQLNMSRSSLNRKIRGTLDISPNNYIRLERLKAAATLLKEGRSKVNEVCYMVGFTSPSYFTKCFYQQFGLLPKDFNK